MKPMSKKVVFNVPTGFMASNASRNPKNTLFTMACVALMEHSLSTHQTARATAIAISQIAILVLGLYKFCRVCSGSSHSSFVPVLLYGLARPDLGSHCANDTCNQARTEVNHTSVDSRHVCVRVEHHRLPARCWFTTSWSGRPRKSSEGKYRRNSPHRGHATVMD